MFLLTILKMLLPKLEKLAPPGTLQVRKACVVLMLEWRRRCYSLEGCRRAFEATCPQGASLLGGHVKSMLRKFARELQMLDGQTSQNVASNSDNAAVSKLHGPKALFCPSSCKECTNLFGYEYCAKY